MSEKIRVSYVITSSAKELLKKLADEQGVSQTAILEILIRKEAKEKNFQND